MDDDFSDKEVNFDGDDLLAAAGRKFSVSGVRITTTQNRQLELVARP